MSAITDSTLIDPKDYLIADMQRQLAECTAERDEALARETATAEVLQVINSSPGDLVPVFDTMLERVLRLCDASYGMLWTYDGECFRVAAQRNIPLSLQEYLSQPIKPGPGTTVERVVNGASIVHVADVREEASYQEGHPRRRAIVELGGVRTGLTVALRKDGNLIGTFVAYRQEVRPFSDKQIALVQNFAAQAVIAMENARLLTETREALEQQTATAEVLKVINGSPGDLAPVFDAILDRAQRVCGVDHAALELLDGERFRAVAVHGASERFAETLRHGYPAADSPAGRALLEGERFAQIVDAAEVDHIAFRIAAEIDGVRTVLFVPLRRDGVLLGMIASARRQVRPFSEKEIALLENFAAQAVIAMENARLLSETREALEQQTATAEVLQVINSSPGNLAPVFDAMLEKAHHLCGIAMGSLELYDGERFRAVAVRGLSDTFSDMLRQGYPAPDNPATRPLIEGERFTYIRDLAETDYAITRSSAKLDAVRTLLCVPLRRENQLLGMIASARKEVRPFSEKEMALIENFAAQAVIAMDNARLITETREARDAAEAALRDLQTAQASLVHARKMAALGELTAGIAHEIKNPLNFVNNFAGLSIELLDELKETTAPIVARLEEDKRAEVDETIEMLTSNLDKIAEHGKRADGIVRSMLEHSRGVAGERRAVNLNALLDETLNLAYHGARAQDQDFDITMERDLDPGMQLAEVVPQDMTRVFLNLIGNGFYAATKRKQQAAAAFRPVLKVMTHDLGDAVEIRIRDNGIGIPTESRDRLFQPFFTTKPTGEGTGLGLSISYDIITQQHRGTITVDSEPGAYTEFTIRLPRQAGAGGTA